MPYSSENADPLLSVIARIKRNPRRAILLTGIVLFVLMGMFPPWKETFQASGAFSENPKGYAFIAAPPKVQNERVQGMHINMSQLIVQWAMLAAGMGVGFFLSKPGAPGTENQGG